MFFIIEKAKKKKIKKNKKKIKIQFQIFQKEQYYDFNSFNYNIDIKMTQYNTFHVKLPNSLRNKLKSAIENRTEITFSLST